MAADDDEAEEAQRATSPGGSFAVRSGESGGTVAEWSVPLDRLGS